MSPPASTAVAAPSNRPLERLLSLFTDVRPGEAPWLFEAIAFGALSRAVFGDSLSGNHIPAPGAVPPSLAIARWVKTAENSVDYSLMNTVRHMLFLPMTRDEKFKAKQVVDSFVVRAGDERSAATIHAGTTFPAAGASQFSWMNAGRVLVWLAFAVAIGREFRRRTEWAEQPA